MRPVTQPPSRATARSASCFRLALALGLTLVRPLAASQVGADDFRVSAMGGTGSVAYAAGPPAVAYNPDADEFLVIWPGDTNLGGTANGEWAIFGQRLDAATGAEVGADDFRVSGIVGGDFNASNFRTAVAYNPTHQEYLAVWVAVSGLCCGSDYEIFVQRLAPDGTQLGADDLRVSRMRGPDTFEHPFVALAPAVAYNPAADEYLVVWAGDDGENGLVDEEFEIWGQRLDGATAAEIGTDDFRISDLGGTGSTFFDASDPDVAYNAIDDEYLVVWHGDDDVAPLVDGELEIFGQRIDGATGAEVGANDFRVSAIGPDGSTIHFAADPAVAHDPVHDAYLVVWTGTELALSASLFGLEIYGQRLDAAGTAIGGDLLLSDVGGIDEFAFDADFPDVVVDPATSLYVVAFRADDDVDGQVDGELEIHLQAIDGATGAEVGSNDERVSDMGPNGSLTYQAAFPALAPAPAHGELLVVWRGDDDLGGLVDGEFEIFGQRLRVAGPLVADGFETGAAGSWSHRFP